MTSRRK